MSMPVFAPIFAGSSLGLAFGGLYIALILFACVMDVRMRRIPNNLVAVLALSGVLFSIQRFGAIDGTLAAFGGLLSGFALWIVFYALGVLGAGDVKFFAAASAWLGASLAWRAALLAAALGGVLAVVFLLRQSRLAEALRRVALVPLSRSLAVTTIEEMSGTEARQQLPYGVALGAGVAVAALFPSILT